MTATAFGSYKLSGSRVSCTGSPVVRVVLLNALNCINMCGTFCNAVKVGLPAVKRDPSERNGYGGMPLPYGLHVLDEFVLFVPIGCRCRHCDSLEAEKVIRGSSVLGAKTMVHYGCSVQPL